MTATAKFTIGDMVWSKMKGYCPWPSRIAESSESSLKPPNNAKGAKPCHLVYFFGSNNFAWLSEEHIKPYDDFKDKNKNGSKSVQFREGLKQIEEYIKTGGQSHATNTNSAINNVTSSAVAGAGDTLKDLEDLPSIDEEIAIINNKKQTASSPIKASHITLNDPHKSTVTSAKERRGRKAVKEEEENAACAKRIIESGQIQSESPPPSGVAPPAAKRGRNAIMSYSSSFQEVPTALQTSLSQSSVPAKLKNIEPSELKFGFVGVGVMGQRLLKNLINSGHQVTIWNRSHTKVLKFIEAGAKKADTPADVVIEADITFSCLSDPKASKEIVFGPFGILGEMNPSKGFVEMSSIDPETSNDISEAILGKGGRYLEAPMIANGKQAAEEGELTIVAAGDRWLYEKCSSCFQAMAKKTMFLAPHVGPAARMNLIFSMLYGTMIGSLIECLTLIERTEMKVTDFKEILNLSPMNCPLLDSKLDQIMENDFTVRMGLGHLQKDLRLSLALAEEHDQTIPITSATNEVFKMAKRYGYTDHDAAALYLRFRY